MPTLTVLFLIVATRVSGVFSAPPQVPFDVATGMTLSIARSAMTLTRPSFQVAASRNLTGRFLHITDMHPDPYYIPHSSIKQSCHRKKPKKKKKQAGYYGTPFQLSRRSSEFEHEWLKRSLRECDSPLTLTNLTLDFLDQNWSSEIDFVICTRLSIWTFFS